MFGLKLSYLRDHAFDGKLNKGHLSYTYQWGIWSLNFGNRVEAYVGIGGFKTSLQFRHDPFFSFTLDGSHQLAIEGGGRASIIFWGDTVFSLDAKYVKALPAVVRQFEINQSSASSKGFSLGFSGWQIGGGIAHPFGFFTLYEGACIFQTQVKLKKLKSFIREGVPTRFIFQNRYKTCVFLGATLSTYRAFSFTLEGRFLGEEGLAGALDLKF